MIRDTFDGYGAVSRFLHWTMALALFGVFALGLWMTGLDFYSPYYHSAPDLHKSIGMAIFAVLVARVLWRSVNVRPGDDELGPLERKVARGVHTVFYLLILVLIASGYLMSTADGRSIDVFGVLSVPALVIDKSLEDPASLVHEITAWGLIVLSLLHAGAALKHHIVDRQPTLRRMLRRT